jgi:IS5 family transposase
MMSYWERVDERLIKRGMLIMDLDFVRGCRDELVRMNRRKRGRPYRIAESYVRFLAVISRRRGHLKIHLAIDARTGEIVYFERTTDRVHDSEVAKRIVDRSMGAGNVIKVIGDGAYDSIRLIRHLERRGIEPIIRPRRDARTDGGPPSRRSAARMMRDYGYRAWSRIVGYGRRWMAETAISRFKELFGEHLLSRKPRWMDAELMLKAFIYNMLLSAVTT